MVFYRCFLNNPDSGLLIALLLALQPGTQALVSPLGADGYPLEIPFLDNGIDGPQSIRTLMVWDLEEHYPGGNYRLVAEGTGIIRLWGSCFRYIQLPD
ncbi:MAG: hypothetical protein R2784_12375 [Saprospiraceae bacterium]